LIGVILILYIYIRGVQQHKHYYSITTTMSAIIIQQQCCAATKAGAQCKKSAAKNSQLCALHTGLGATPQFARAVLQNCQAKTKAGTPCRNTVKGGNFCGIHSKAPSTGPKKIVGWNVFTSIYNSDLWELYGDAKLPRICAEVWRAERDNDTELYHLCQKGDKSAAIACALATYNPEEPEDSEEEKENFEDPGDDEEAAPEEEKENFEDPGEAGDEDYDPEEESE